MFLYSKSSIIRSNMNQSGTPPRISVILDGKLAGVVREINQEGLTFSTQKTLKRGEHVVLGLSMPGMLRSLDVRGVVLDCTPEGVEVGFVDMPPESLTGLKTMLGRVNETIVPQASGGKKHILLVEDSEQIRQVYKGRLMLDGYIVMAVGSAIDGLAYLRDNVPDLVLLDLIMPIMDGFKFLQVVRESPKLAELPVIILSAKGATSEIERASALGISGYLIKTTTSPVKLSQEIKDFFRRVA